MANILLIEDDPLTLEFFRRVLESRGHVVDAARDGFDAAEFLARRHYDIALLDYHLPELDGYAAARMLTACTSLNDRPLLVAITGDPAGVMSRSGSDTLFEAVLPKPVDQKALFALVERLMRDPERERLRQASRGFWRERGLADRPRAFVAPAPTREQRLALELCFDLAARPGDAELILLQSASGLDEAARARAIEPGAHLLPVVDMTGELTAICDASFKVGDPDTWAELAGAVLRFARQREALAPSARDAADLATRLMVYTHLSGRPLEPVRDPRSKVYFRYRGLFHEADAELAAERLAREGYLERRFVDRFHACKDCGSHRLNVREECPACRSPELAETALLHHFQCAHLGPEDAFRAGRKLVCPKCRVELRHYGADYERAGTALECGACRAINSEPAVGFVCMDCAAHTDGEAAPTRDVHAYVLTARARDLLAKGEEPQPSLPPDVLRALRELRAREPEPPETVIVTEIHYAATQTIVASRGAPIFARLRRLFLENLGNLIGDIGRVVPGAEVDYLLLRDVGPEELERSGSALLSECEALLAPKLAAEFRVVGPFREAA
ncbi:response regulator [Alsobacter sp. SYSU M60028]|uniref:Response regulator n=1 Tax=Alsobacter ponti TaxID=2962936 RepID=A0ABT1L7S2_9HYPH|nr:response regulator [Alsobacter ponti]